MLKKKIITLTLALLMAVLIPAGAASAAYIGDMRSSDWAYPYVSYMVDNNIMPLEDDGNFYGDTLTTRGEFVLYLWRAAGCPAAVTTGSTAFSDVYTSDSYYDAVEWAVGHNITTGTSKTTFDPDLALNREQAFTFLWRALPYFGVSASTDWEYTLENFKDVSYVHEWASKPMSDLYYLGIVTGTDDGYLMPLQDVARSATAAILYRTMDLGGSLRTEADEPDNMATLYLLADGAEYQYELGYTGKLTPDKLMDGLTDLTGLNFAYTHFDQVGDELRVHWSDDASFMPYADIVYLNPYLDIDLYDDDMGSTMQFMLDSAWKTLSVNLDAPRIYFSDTSDDGLDFSDFIAWAIPGDEWYSGNFYDYYSN